jgi:anti-sigma factor RsiW
MSEISSPVREEDLHAYVDGQLSPERRRQVEEHLKREPADAERVQAYREINEALRRLYQPVLAEPVPERLGRRPARRWHVPTLRIAASVLLLLTGTLVGWQIRGVGERLTPEPTSAGHYPMAAFAQQAALAYAVYTPEVRHPVEVPAEQEQHLVAWLSKRLGTEIRAPSLQGEGFQLVGGRLLPGEDSPAALFMYEDEHGKRLILYVAPHANGEETTAFRFTERGSAGVFYWVDGPLGYALVGEMDRTRLLAVAHSVYEQLSF